MKSYLKAILGFFLATVPFVMVGAQNIQKAKGNVNGRSFNYYYFQPHGKIIGLLILLPGSGEHPQSIFDKTKLPENLLEKEYLTIVPELDNSLFADESTIAELDEIVKMATEKYRFNSLIIGGLSSGGAVAAGYAEYKLAKDSATLLKGLIIIDAPLDLKRIYASAERKINYGCGGLIMKEGYSLEGELDRTLNGSPDARPDQYLKHSSYSSDASDGGNAKFLKNIPVRLYTEPDLAFVKKTYCTDLQFDDINAFDLEGLNKFLLKIGNNRCQYIATQGKGFHSWNIVDPVDCTRWILNICN